MRMSPDAAVTATPFILSTAAKVRCRSATHRPLKKGDLIYVPPLQLHSFYTDRENRLSTYNLYCELWNAEHAPSEHHLYWKEEDYEPELLTEIRSAPFLDAWPYYSPMQHHGFLTDLFIQIVKEHRKQQPLADEAAHGLLKAFLLSFAQASAEGRTSDYRMTAIMDRIDREAHAGSDYESWLAQSGLQKTQFHAQFKRSAGISPKAYWTRAVMRQASAALWESNRSITSIAEDLSYPSIHPFTKRFTAYYGVSPTQFRKRKHEQPRPNGSQDLSPATKLDRGR